MGYSSMNGRSLAYQKRVCVCYGIHNKMMIVNYCSKKSLMDQTLITKGKETLLWTVAYSLSTITKGLRGY